MPCLPAGGRLYVTSPYCQAFHLRSLPLSPECLSPPRSQVHSGGFTQPPVSQGCLFPFFLLALRASVLFPHPVPDEVSLSLLSGIHLRFLPLSPESLSPLRSLVHSGGSPQPPISRGCLFPFFLLALRAVVLSLTPNSPPTTPPSCLSTFPTRSLPPSPLVIAFFSQVGLRHSHLGISAC